MTRSLTMFRLALVALAIGCGSVSAFGQALDLQLATKPDAFHDLPGVKMPDDLNAPPAADNCKQSVRNLPNRFDDRGRNLPVLVYKCEQGGLTFESTLPPSNRNTNYWNDNN